MYTVGIIVSLSPKWWRGTLPSRWMWLGSIHRMMSVEKTA